MIETERQSRRTKFSIQCTQTKVIITKCKNEYLDNKKNKQINEEKKMCHESN